MEARRFIAEFKETNKSSHVAVNGDTFLISMGNWAIVGGLNYDLPQQFADLTGKTFKINDSNVHLSTVVAYGLIPFRPNHHNVVVSFTLFQINTLKAVEGVDFEKLNEACLKLSQTRIIENPENVISVDFCENHALLAELIDSLSVRH
jgi:hypothetical protein